jgi:methylenetetrahydrofolate reductase (NADPH)
MRDYVSGVYVPEELITRLEGAKSAKEEGVKVCLETVEQLKGIEGVHGVHIMAVAWEEVVPGIVEGAKLLPRPAL